MLYLFYISKGDVMSILWLSSNVCEISVVLKLILFVKTILKYACIIIPIGLIVMSSVDIAKNVITSNEGDMQKNFNLAMKRIIYCMVIFLIPPVVNLAVNLVNNSISLLNVNVSNCFDNLDNISYYENIEEERRKIDEEKYQKQALERLAKIKEGTTIKKTKKKASSLNAENDNNSGATVTFGQKYNLSDSQLRGLAMVAQREQGTPVGAAAEASLMANRFELYGSKCGNDGTGLYNYVGNINNCANGLWFANASTIMQNTSGLDPDILAAVKEVLVLGKRTLPLYVDEHDCIDCGVYGFNIDKIITNGTTISDASGLKNHNNYKRDETIINNIFGSVYTFYTFPTESSDPFGYTAEARSKFN